MTDVVVPDLGESVSEAIVAAWLRKPGEAVAVDEPLVVLETDKATVEICAPSAGVVAEVLIPEGETVSVGTVLAKLEPAGEGAAVAAPKTEVAPAPAAAEPAAAGLDPTRVERSGPSGQITASDLLEFLGEAPAGERREGPAARKLLASTASPPRRWRPRARAGA